MIYEEAAKLIAKHAPDLHIDPNVPGQQHVNVRKTEDGPPHSIMLPQVMGQDPAEVKEQEETLFLAALNHAGSML